MTFKILFSNIGYAKGIDGSLKQHIAYFLRHLHTPHTVQERVLAQIKIIINAENPDLCCFVEIDRGSFNAAGFNQISALTDTEYQYHDITDKYGPESALGRMPLHRGKSNGFLAKANIPFKRLYLSHGSKRLVYCLKLPDNTHLFFAHFSLRKNIRLRQFQELRQLIEGNKGEVIILADFNIMSGFRELDPLLHDTDLKVISREDKPTFRFYRHHMVLDLCLCSHSLASRIDLNIIPQPFSDHAALSVTIG